MLYTLLADDRVDRLYRFRASRRPAAVNKAIGVAGVALLGRAATNLELRQLTGFGARRHAFSAQNTIRINAPVERVFAGMTKCFASLC